MTVRGAVYQRGICQLWNNIFLIRQWIFVLVTRRKFITLFIFILENRFEFYSYGGENLPKKGEKRNSEKRFRPLTHMFLKLLRFLNYQKEIMLFKRDPFAAKLYARRSSENLRSKIYHSISFLI